MVTGDGGSPTVCTPRRESLNVALLMPVKERERWKDLTNGLSEYYNSPGRLAVVRR